MPAWIRCIKRFDHIVGQNARLVLSLKWAIFTLFLTWNLQAGVVYHFLDRVFSEQRIVCSAAKEKWALRFFRQKLVYATSHHRRYTAERYCHDLIQIRWKQAATDGSVQCNFKSQACIGKLQQIMQGNYDLGFGPKQAQRRCVMLRVMTSHKDEFEAQEEKIRAMHGVVAWKITGKDVIKWLPHALLWLVWFFCTTRLTTLLWMLVGMSEMGGVLDVFCMDTKKFFWALFAWRGFFEFPDSLYRVRLRAEGKYRAHYGILFRRLTREETREILSHCDSWESYKVWAEELASEEEPVTAGIRVRNTVRLCFALLAVLFFAMVTAALAANAASKESSGRCTVACAANTADRAGPSLSVDRDDGGTSFASAEIMPVASDLPEPDLVVWWKVFSYFPREQRRWRDIEHVPYFGWLVVGFITAIQSAGAILRHNGGNQNAERYGINLSGNRAALNYGPVWGQ